MELFYKLIFLAGLAVLVSGGGGSSGSSASSYASSSASSFGGGGTSSGGGSGGYGGGYGAPSGFGGGAPSGFGGGGYGPGGYGGYGGGGGFPGYGFPNPPGFPDPFSFQKYLQDYLNQMHEWTKMQAQAASANSIPGCASSGLGDRIGGAGVSAPGGDGTVGAVASGSIGPGGGYGSTKVFPSSGGSGGGLNDRIGPVAESSGPFPAPSGGNVGISSFSSSSSSDIDGKKSSQKSSVVSVNDNGKVTTYTSHDP